MISHPETFESARNEIAYAYDKTAFFRRHMDEARLRVQDIGKIEDLGRIPPTEKKHYRRNFPAGVLASDYSMNSLELHRVQSSGTTGERLVTMEVGLVYLQRALESLSVNPELSGLLTARPRKHVRYAAPNCSDVECANPNSAMKDRLLKDGTLVLSVYHDLLTTPERLLEMNVQEIEIYRPQMYYVDPTHLAFLLRYMRQKNIEPYKASVLSSYTLCTQTAKRQIRESLGYGVPFLEAFAMSELGWFAVECPCGRVHLNNRSFFMELLTQGRPAVPGEWGELYITTLDNGCTPHIRYRTGDIFSWSAEPCPCGSPFPVVRIEGRLRHFVFRGGQAVLSPRGLDDLVGAPDWLDLYKLEQADEDDFVFTFVANEKYEPKAESALERDLRNRLGSTARLRVERSRYISTERSGKFISCVSAVGERLNEGGFQI